MTPGCCPESPGWYSWSTARSPRTSAAGRARERRRGAALQLPGTGGGAGPGGPRAPPPGPPPPAGGDGLPFPPAEPLNPEPDPTDPSSQRLGAWMLLAEGSWKSAIASLAWAPSVFHSDLGLPAALDVGGGLVAARAGFRPSG